MKFRFLLLNSCMVITNLFAWNGIEFKDDYLRLSAAFNKKGTLRIRPKRTLPANMAPNILVESNWYRGGKRVESLKGNTQLPANGLSIAFDSAGTEMGSEYRIRAYLIDPNSGAMIRTLIARDTIEFEPILLNQSRDKVIIDPFMRSIVQYEPLNMNTSMKPTGRQIGIAVGVTAGLIFAGLLAYAGVKGYDYYKTDKAREEAQTRMNDLIREIDETSALIGPRQQFTPEDRKKYTAELIALNKKVQDAESKIKSSRFGTWVQSGRGYVTIGKEGSGTIMNLTDQLQAMMDRLDKTYTELEPTLKATQDRTDRIIQQYDAMADTIDKAIPAAQELIQTYEKVKPTIEQVQTAAQAGSSAVSAMKNAPSAIKAGIGATAGAIARAPGDLYNWYYGTPASEDVSTNVDVGF